MTAKEICPAPKRCFFGLCQIVAIAVLLALAARPLLANVPPAKNQADICTQAARNAATTTGIPLSILLAITLTETGRKKDGAFTSWPWTVNMEGAGKWFDTREAAQAFARDNFARGARSFDVGCFQINYKWHSKGFSSIEQMFDPDANALYAARYLLDLFEEKQNWTAAAGAYHSRTKKYSDKYSKRFARIHASVSGSPDLPIVARVSKPRQTIGPRTNSYPLLQTLAGEAAKNGSLVSLTGDGQGKALIEAGNGRLF